MKNLILSISILLCYSTIVYSKKKNNYHTGVLVVYDNNVNLFIDSVNIKSIKIIINTLDTMMDNVHDVFWKCHPKENGKKQIIKFKNDYWDGSPYFLLDTITFIPIKIKYEEDKFSIDLDKKYPNKNIEKFKVCGKEVSFIVKPTLLIVEERP